MLMPTEFGILTKNKEVTENGAGHKTQHHFCLQSLGSGTNKSMLFCRCHSIFIKIINHTINLVASTYQHKSM